MSRRPEQPRESPSDSPIVALGFFIVLMIAYWIATDVARCQDEERRTDATCQVETNDAD